MKNYVFYIMNKIFIKPVIRALKKKIEEKGMILGGHKVGLTRNGSPSLIREKKLKILLIF